MIIINTTTCGEKTYIVSIGTNLIWSNLFKVAAYNEQSAVDLVADYIESHEWTGLYFDHAELEIMAECSEWKTAEAFAEAHNLTCCGNHDIYTSVLNIEEVAE